MSGANNYSGGTTVSDGVLQGTTTSLQGAITNDATVTFNQSIDGTYAGAMSRAGDVTKEGTGNATFSGINTYSGTTTVNAGTLTINGSIVSATTVNAAGTLAGTGAVNASVTNNGTVSAGVGGSGTFTVDSFYEQQHRHGSGKYHYRWNQWRAGSYRRGRPHGWRNGEREC